MANCRTVEERKKTDELIRPILRGRDIKRYGYNWANLYLIATFPSRHYDIDQYPSVKNYLLSFGMERLEQTGEIHTVNGETVKARKLTKNKWFETQDSIGYWEDFLKPKIIYPETTQGAYFALDTEGLFIDKTCFFLISPLAEHLQVILSSKLFEFAYKRLFSSVELGPNGYQYNKQAFLKLPIIKPLGNIISREVSDNIIYSLYRLTDEEVQYVENTINN